jgi:hypothetical protein
MVDPVAGYGKRREANVDSLSTIECHFLTDELSLDSGSGGHEKRIGCLQSDSPPPPGSSLPIDAKVGYGITLSRFVIADRVWSCLDRFCSFLDPTGWTSLRYLNTVIFTFCPMCIHAVLATF